MASPDTVRPVLEAHSLRAVFQPIVDLDQHTVVAYESLTRGPIGSPLESPLELFAAARAEGMLAELDAACRRHALRAAVDAGLQTPLTVFVNVEPEVIDGAPLRDLLDISLAAPRHLPVVFEISARAIAARPGELLRTADRIREFGWAVALDDVGADPRELAFVSLVKPEVVKLDLRLIQERTVGRSRRSRTRSTPTPRSPARCSWPWASRTRTICWPHARSARASARAGCSGARATGSARCRSATSG